MQKTIKEEGKKVSKKNSKVLGKRMLRKQKKVDKRECKKSREKN